MSDIADRLRRSTSGLRVNATAEQLAGVLEDLAWLDGSQLPRSLGTRWDALMDAATAADHPEHGSILGTLRRLPGSRVAALAVELLDIVRVVSGPR